MISAARQAAYDITRAVDSGRSDLARSLAETRDALRDARDRGLATDIAIGTQRWRAQLDFLIEAASGRQVGRLDLEVLAILRLSAYQLRHLARVPPAAVVNDAVALTHRARKRSAAGFVNAVLRKVASTPASLPPLPTAAPDRDAWYAQALAYLSITHAHPVWLVERWLARYGWEATASWVAFNNATPTVTLWPSPRRRDAAPPRWPGHQPTTWVEGGMRLDEAAEALPLMRDGVAFAQDEASAVVATLAAAVARSPMLDACASPGGKTLALDAALPPPFRLVAADLRTARVQTLRDRLARHGGRPIAVVQADATALPFAGTIESVLLDAPCSGLGTLRRDPDVKWRRTADDVTRLAAAQRAMIDHALRVVGREGLVVYATCSSEPEENEALIRAGVATGQWRVVDARQADLPGRVAELVAPEGWVRTLPHLHDLDAFFAAVLVTGDAAAGRRGA